jgi:uncharacterized protein YdeI (YjbR/CyaY-like superfamily)
MKNASAAVDQYIEKAAPFAQPVLKRIRAAFHKAAPDIVETMKWSTPFFEHKGVVGNMAAFKNHVSWGFWKAKLMNDPHGILNPMGETGTMGGLKVTTVAELPAEKIMLEYIREAIRLNEEDVRIVRAKKAPQGEAEVPDDLAAALKKSPKARKTFDGFPPSHRREYVAWITEAKQPSTREKRLAQTIEWLTEGKPRNWKYMR